MQYTARLPQEMKLYYNAKVYSPQYSSIDTILVVDKLIRDCQVPTATVLDVGCGSGVIGLGVKTLNPGVSIILCDVDKEAVRVAKLNAKRLGLSVEAKKSDMVPVGYWDIIVANLPTYSDEDMEQELHGPAVAYYSKEPLALYAKLFDQAKDRCQFLVCECQAKYQEPFLKLAKKKGYRLILQSEFGFAFTRPSR